MKSLTAVVLAALSLSPISQSVAAPQDDMTAIGTQLVGEFMAAWGTSDPAAIARLFADDGDLVTPDGTLSQGHAEIEAFYAGAFAHGYRGSHAEARIARVRVLAPGTAIIDATWSIAGARAPDGAARATESGTMVGVIALRNGAARVIAMRESTSASSLVPLTARAAP